MRSSKLTNVGTVAGYEVDAVLPSRNDISCFAGLGLKLRFGRPNDTENSSSSLNKPLACHIPALLLLLQRTVLGTVSTNTNTKATQLLMLLH